MANNDATLITTGKPKVSGAIFYAPLGTELPQTADAVLDAAFVCVGLISDDGLKKSQSRESTDIKEWGGATVKTIQKSVDETFKFKMIEALKDTVQKAVYGEANVSGALTTGMTIKHNSAEPVEHAWVIDTIMSNGALARTVVPDGKITDIGEISYKADEVIGYEATLKALADTDGNTSYDYIKNAG